MATAQDIINKAKSYIGTKESPANSNNVVFNTDYYGKKVSGSAYPWCMVFVWDIFRLCGASNLFYNGNKIASCTSLMNWAKTNKCFYTSNYKPGDIIFYNFNSDSKSEHTGILVSVNSDGTITAIEGNTSINGSQDNGGMVCQKTRKKSLILGVYRPNYATPSTEYTQKQFILDVQKILGVAQTGACSITGNTFKKTITINKNVNNKHALVIPIEKRLKQLGYYNGAIDGNYGTGMANAVNQYAKSFGGKGLDGEITSKGATWKHLLGIL